MAIISESLKFYTPLKHESKAMLQEHASLLLATLLQNCFFFLSTLVPNLGSRSNINSILDHLKISVQLAFLPTPQALLSASLYPLSLISSQFGPQDRMHGSVARVLWGWWKAERLGFYW